MEPGFVTPTCTLQLRTGGTCVRAASYGWKEVARRIPPFDMRLVVEKETAKGEEARLRDRLRERWHATMVEVGVGKELLESTVEAAVWMTRDFVDQLSTTTKDYSPPPVTVRLALLRRTQCPRIHYDKVPLRALLTLTGPGTVYARDEDVHWPTYNTLRFVDPTHHERLENSSVPRGLRHTPENTALFLAPPTLHRSPRTNETRVLIQCDVANETDL